MKFEKQFPSLIKIEKTFGTIIQETSGEVAFLKKDVQKHCIDKQRFKELFKKHFVIEEDIIRNRTIIYLNNQDKFLKDLGIKEVMQNKVIK